MVNFNLAEAKAKLSELVRRAAQGDEVVISRRGVPVARLVAYRSPTPRRPGAGEGQWEFVGDFSELEEELLASFEGLEG